ncbi:MAG: hypothetical protein AAFW73_08780 [Bacteroidota bacterium]
MQRVSTSATILLKFFLPTFWMVFFGSIAGALLLSEQDFYGRISIFSIRIGMIGFFLFGVAVLYWSVMRLKRVEMDPHFVYVTNYFKTYRYPYHNIEKMTESDYLFFRSIHIHLKEAGNFGRKITFVVSQKLFKDFLSEHPEIAQQLIEETEA